MLIPPCAATPSHTAIITPRRPPHSTVSPILASSLPNSRAAASCACVAWWPPITPTGWRAGVPLSFAFIATLGRLGLVTVVMREVFGFNIYATGFNLISFFGLCMVYLYFQIPLMVLIITPALDGLKREWREAAECLGASGMQYWRMVAFPVLWPSLLGTFALLFANAFGAVATAMALTGSSLTIVPIKLFAQIRGDTLQNPHLGYAIAFGMIVITGIANVVYIMLRARAERWMK